MQYNPNLGDDAVMAALRADAAVQAAAKYGVYEAEPSDGTDTPHIIVQVVSDTPNQFLDGSGYVTVNYLIRGVDTDRASAGDAVSAAVARLEQGIDIPGYISAQRSSGGQRYLDGAGFWNATAYVVIRWNVPA